MRNGDFYEKKKLDFAAHPAYGGIFAQLQQGYRAG